MVNNNILNTQYLLYSVPSNYAIFSASEASTLCVYLSREGIGKAERSEANVLSACFARTYIKLCSLRSH